MAKFYTLCPSFVAREICLKVRPQEDDTRVLGGENRRYSNVGIRQQLHTVCHWTISDGMRYWKLSTYLRTQ